MNNKIKKNNNTDVFVDRYMKDYFPSVPNYSNEEIVRMCNIFLRTRDLEIRNKLIEANIRNVIKCAYSRHNRDNNLDLEELISIGLEGLSEIIDRYDGLATDLQSYVKNVVNKRFDNSFKSINSIKINSSDYKSITAIRAAINEYYYTDMTEDVIDYINRTTNIDKNKIKLLINVIDDSVDFRDIDIIHSGKEEVTINNEVISEIINRLLNTYLKENERIVITERFGLNGHAPKHLEELAHEFGRTPERIRQIQVKALRKLKMATGRLSVTRKKTGNPRSVTDRSVNKYKGEDLLQAYAENQASRERSFIGKVKAEGYSDYLKDYEGLSEEEYENRGMGFK